MGQIGMVSRLFWFCQKPMMPLFFITFSSIDFTNKSPYNGNCFISHFIKLLFSKHAFINQWS
ncbi:hypothetical protein MOMA_01445 [Moraxella macacae 0408225]|uniref:Uncharacterized protein n=1 Tax=Moraxella macacae 0408225 TaxID=1230338 RepID=L2F7M6_9GAMM|nr:hypothetical protein MOMA_01445 [Moraxella macacae 0408225]